MIDLTGRICLVTGAAQGIGKAISEGFARRGATVIATSLEKPACDGAALELVWDVARPEQAGPVVAQIMEKFGRLDIFVANAGYDPRQKWHDIPLADWNKILDTNLNGAWHGAQAAARAMTSQGYGKIVFVSSIEVSLGVAEHCHYDAAKAGLIGLTRSMARAVGAQGVRVNCLMPGAIRTPNELRHFPDQEAVTKAVDARQCIPGRIEAEDIEPAFAFLCSAESDAITGQVLCVDQGYTHW